MTIATIALDITSRVFRCMVLIPKDERFCGDQMAVFFANLSPCLVGLEACCGSHYWSRLLSRFGHTVRLIAPQFVKPYVKSNKMRL